MSDTPKSVQKDIIPVTKPVDETPRRTDGVSQLCKSTYIWTDTTGMVANNTDEGHVFEATPDDRRQIGVVSASFLIFNRVIGTGVFATPSTILSLSGSVGLSLIMWAVGTLIAMAGTAVYLEWGTAIPKYFFYPPPKK